MVYFDLDEVIRSLSVHAMGYVAPSWEIPYLKDGVDFLDVVENNLELLFTAPHTEIYDKIVRFLPYVNILSHQPMSWRPFTTAWIYRKFTFSQVTLNYVDEAKEKLTFLKKDDYLIDDFPFFEDYSQIVLVDKPYNKKVKPFLRVNSTDDLKKWIQTIK